MKTKYDWSNVSKNVNYLTTDSYGNVAGWVSNYYKPSIFGNLWYGADYTNGEPTYYALDLNPYQGGWKDSLEERPNEK